MMFLPLFLAAFPCLCAQDAGLDEIVCLRNGRIIVGEIVEHNLDGLVVVSAESGGRFALDWADLFPTEMERLQTTFGYKFESVVPMVQGDRILLTNGLELTGRVLRKDNRNLEFRVRGITSVIPLSRLAGPPETVLVEAATILTPEQFYSERVTSIDATDPLALFAFAQDLEQVFALEFAEQTLAQCVALAPSDTALLRRVEVMQARLAITIANRAEAEAIEHIRHLIYRESYEAADLSMAEFQSQFPSPALASDFSDLVDKIETSRAASLGKYLARSWFNRVVALLKRKALDREASMESLMSFVEGEAPLLVRMRLLDELKEMKADLTVEELDALWANRIEYRAKPHSAGYGDGTWVLGEDRARAGLGDEEEEDDGKTPQQREMEERMRRFQENQDRARRSSAAGSNEATPEDWWRQAAVTERFQFLLAYYAEFSGDYILRLASFASCNTCTGSGVLKTIEVGAEGGKEKKRKCTTCQGIGVRRKVSFQ